MTSRRGTVLVTGGAGFIGCAMSKGLADLYDRVVMLDNLHPQIHATPTRPDAPFRLLYVGSITPYVLDHLGISDEASAQALHQKLKELYDKQTA